MTPKPNPISTITSAVYTDIFHSCVESIIVVNQQGTILLANPAVSQMFGYGSDELIGHTVEIFIPKKDKTAHVQHRSQFQRKPESRYMGQGRDLIGVKKSGEELPVEISLNPVKVDGEQMTMALIVDITERKGFEAALASSEAQLSRYAAELERRVLERTEELHQTIKDLAKEVKVREKAEAEVKLALVKEREVSELKSRFVSMASHEFRTPLSTILSSASLMIKYSENDDHQMQVKHLNRIKSNVKNLTDILNDFLSIDKIEDGKIPCNLEPLDFSALVADLVEELRQNLKSQQVMAFETNSSHLSVQTDPSIIRHILHNLVFNAIKYSPIDGKITVRLEEKADLITMSVSDTGMGIPLSEQAHLFERFFRAHNVNQIQGTGLGLYLVKKYASLINGTVTFSSEENVGSEFVITIPKIDE